MAHTLGSPHSVTLIQVFTVFSPPTQLLLATALGAVPLRLLFILAFIYLAISIYLTLGIMLALGI